MENTTKNYDSKVSKTSKKTKLAPDQHVCERGNENKIKSAHVSDKNLENWLIAESKYRGFYF